MGAITRYTLDTVSNGNSLVGVVPETVIKVSIHSETSIAKYEVSEYVLTIQYSSITMITRQ